MTYITAHIYTKRHGVLRCAVLLAICILTSLILPTQAAAEIVIGGNVYGGGNVGDLKKSETAEGSTKVVLKAGSIKGSVYGGARMADVEGHAYVNIDGAGQTGKLLVNAVYGGNDIAGTIGTVGTSTLPFTPKAPSLEKSSLEKSSLNAVLYATPNTQYPMIIGSLYGGGNGAYDYDYDDEKGTYTVKQRDNAHTVIATVSNRPELDRTYIELGGGIYSHVFGGGNEATVKVNTTIYAENATALNDTLNQISVADAIAVAFDEDHHVHRNEAVYFDYHVGCLFGGNNVADMDIRPTWYLKKMDINNLYSGGNRGRMTHPNGVILPIQSDDLRANNVYGGCRIADVNPGGQNGEATLTDEKLYEHDFHAGYATRVYITAGRVNNVYGGNDIAGTVYHGSNVDIHGGLIGNVYGGGNGSYAYTDNPEWVARHPEDADYYYSIPDGTEEIDKRSVEALYNFRPHVESTLVHISGSDEKRVVITGDVFCGGNSATLAKAGDQTNARSILKVGKYATIDGVFLGSNGENMVLPNILAKYASKDGDVPFSRINLKEQANMADYMEGVAMNIKPKLQWDDIASTTYVGSLYFGGNKGSMTYSGMNTINVPRDLIIYEKIVGGCNDANVGETEYNAAYQGGVIGEGTGTVGNQEKVKVQLIVDAYLLPHTLNCTYDDGFVKDWSFDWDLTDVITYETYDNKTLNSRTFQDANIYGGCFNSGIIKGGTVINISKPLIHPSVFESQVEVDGKPVKTRDILLATGEDVYGSSMAVYGAGFGESSVVDGNTQINLTGDASLLLVFGGGEQGVVTGNTEVNFDPDMSFPADNLCIDPQRPKINVYKAYGAGYAGPVQGNSTLNLHAGGVLRGFGGACNANIEGYTTAIVGYRDEEGDQYNYGKPYVGNAVFGGNDFGGQVYGDALREIKVLDYSGNELETLQVRSQTYLQYLSGTIEKAVYGGSYGSYDYNNSDIYSRGNPNGSPAFTTTIVPYDENTIATNTFVHINSKSRDTLDVVGYAAVTDRTAITGIIGGGRGYRNLPGYVEVNQTYVLLNGTDYTQRTDEAPMGYRVYGGGNLSLVHNTRIDAYSGTVERIFGGTHGAKTVSLDDNVAYNVGNTLINYYEGMKYDLTDVFGAGANSGTDKAVINLYGGRVHNVHGGAYTEGYTLATQINVPEGSTIQANAIFGGGMGEEERRPCDVGISEINYASAYATVEEGLFGGNNNARATAETKITLNVPLKNKVGNLQTVYGGGYGSATVAGFTFIDLKEGAHVAKVYGGGKEGKVYNHYKYFQASDDDETSEAYAIYDYYSNAPHRYANWINGVIQPEAEKAEPKHVGRMKNTHIIIRQGAVVEKTAFGGGEGTAALVAGETRVDLLGGLVKQDIYGGGDAGAMPRMTSGINGFIASEEGKQFIGTECRILGGQVRKVFGGGLNGDVTGDTHVIVGAEESVGEGVETNVFPNDEVDAGSSLANQHRTMAALTYYNGIPAVQRNVYGGSERAKVTGTSVVDMYNGYIGYEYNTTTQKYTPVLDLDDDLAVREFEDEGNIYGAGYGEGAIAIDTWVNLYGGTVRNSVYGGGEIAAVGVGTVTALGRSAATISTPGSAKVRIYGGLVMGDVFGGGRGYTYTHTYTGEDSPYKTIREYTDGYVFGKTDVEIYRGTIGTAETLLEGRGNVFGGGNIGYVYSSGVKYTYPTNKGEAKINGHYYTDDTFSKRSEDCRVHISVRCLALEDVTIGDETFEKGSYVPTEYLNLLSYNDPLWSSLDNKGVTIYNAVFAGGNVSSGSDVVYANAVTVYGNATAAVVDAFDKDLINIGGEHIGGLYGDGNLTFVDGYRELNLTNYGTSHDYLAANINESTYSKLSARDKAYYEFKEDAADAQRYRRLDGRMINTIQRADFCGIFGCRVLLHGAQDRVPDKVDYTNYAINRVGEISLNRKTVGSTVHGTYFGIYNVANFLGAFTSDVMFDETHSEGNTYYSYKKANLDNSNRNKGTTVHTVAQASGVYLELVKELDSKGDKVYGPVTGVIQLDLINAATGEGGGYVYAQKEYGKRSEVKPELAKQFVLSDANQGAITQSAFTYNQSEIQPMQTSGNFIHAEKHIVDDMFSENVHYWYIRGDHYLHNMVVSAFAGSAQTFVNSLTVPLAFSEKSYGEMQMLSVQPNWYAYYKTSNKNEVLALGDSICIGGKVYHLNDPISGWDYSQLSSQLQNHFVPATYVAITDATLNGVSYKTGQVLLPDAYQNLLKQDGRTQEVFRVSNEMSKDAGYVLNHIMSNPLAWNKSQPTFLCNTGGVYGQQRYETEDLIGKSVYDDHQDVAGQYTGEATFEAAYIATEDVTFTVNSVTRTVFAGSYINETLHVGIDDDAAREKFERAYYCTNTIEVEDKVFILTGELISTTRYDALKEQEKAYFSEAYVCTAAGLYGGMKFEKGEKYDALKYVALPKNQRTNFTFNYDALDLFSTDFDEDLTLYRTPFYENLDVNFKATYTGDETSLEKLKATGDGYEEFAITKGTVLNRAEFELILNEQSHYEPINVDPVGTYHIVREEFEYDNVIYYVGKVVDNGTYDKLSSDNKKKCDNKEFTSIGTYYYCAEPYRSAPQGADGTADGSQSVPKGTIKTEAEYNALKNDQKNFAIANDPTLATAKLYVPRESDIYNLSEDRIISVEYKYRYNEPKSDGTHEVRVEKHIVNINIQFRNGQPTIGTLAEPGTVLPNSVIGLSVPVVVPGAYEVIGSGWEIYKTLADAENHQNGAVYKNNATPMYWYQNGYYVAYYTKTYLGRSYSNAVPLSIANYHRLGEVMNHKVLNENGEEVNEYMYIDHEDVKAPSKIYLDAAPYLSTSIAADSHVTDSPNGKTDGKNDLDYLYDLYVAASDGRLDQNEVANCYFMDFILRSDIAPKKYAGNWPSVGVEGKCFSGNFHGNGYTISGLDKSLFGYLCGSVYNLGVTGSFTGGGIADNGGGTSDGYAENCWVYTTGTPVAGAIIGTGGTVVNSYYHYRADNGFAAGNGTAKSQAEFDMGEVAYLLNAFYLDKRFRANNNLISDDNEMKYVENYFANGDFRYADGTVPTEMDVRYDANSRKYAPIYPDDYIFFGQQLTYVPDPIVAQEKNMEVHESLPGRIDKILIDGVERIPTNNSNRVYRAPAYRQSKGIDKVYFNTFAYFANSCNEQPIHSNLTAIDFTGHNDFEYKDASEGYRPYLDYAGLEHVNFTDLTSNLLIYADPVNDSESYAVLSDLYVPVLIFGKKVGDEYVNNYSELGVQANLGNVHGHLVDLVIDGGNRTYVARRNQILVDKEDFNAPIRYTFDKGYYMWHQRTPAHYTEGNGKGWESLCLPFEADMTTTQDKGQITHFYEGSTANHEYWLRELESVTTADGKTSALFQRPAAGTQSLVVKNRFLYDYYYSYNDGKDDNEDSYQNYYSQEERTYAKYPNIKAYKPYIMAFPGVRYYEFDMSGQFVPQHTGDDIAQLAPQVVTFVSVDNATVAVTDDALAAQASTVNNYSYTGALINEAIGSNYVLDADGEKFENSGKLVPFRAYMTRRTSGAAPHHILIGSAVQDEEPMEEILQRGLKIWGKGETIYIESTLEYEAVVTVYGLSGQLVRRVTVKPMSKETVPVSSRGVYIVNNKKVAVL